ncbi:CCCH zinc finger protein [Blumeria hordei DH14]|uniref:CCCH zinc finger protein n=1 Tax=Blumeria graminis f. sp. hordei (strain DH14) TaxID=546991 RepID=N1JLC6_BLUG1|nr:CCCH zinc finger protein [Blumeria hordei DH14]
MSSEDQNILLNQISQLAGKSLLNILLLGKFLTSIRLGQINRYKNGQIHNEQIPTPHSKPYRGQLQSSVSWRPQRGGHSRGGGLNKPGQAYRNRSLVLTGNNLANPNTSVADQSHETVVPPSAGVNWVSKTDRHRQLINASIFSKAAQNRTKAMEETRKQKLKQRQEREKSRLQKYLQREDPSSIYGSSNRVIQGVGNHEVNVQGIRFLVAKNGSKLIKIPGDINLAKSTPKVASVGPVKFYRSKNGNMYRSGIIKAHRATGIVKKIDEPCKIFTTTGSCPKGPRCRYIHDPSKVAVCKEFLLKGSCASGESCDLSHELTPERTPSCLHFTRGNCANPNCRYIHVRVSPLALVCRPFGMNGYCEKGSTCTERHIHECPDFSNTGTCNNRGCKLLHREKASVMRNRASRSNGEDVDAPTSDVSSDEEEIDSDDVDSDDLEEFFGDDDGESDTDIPMQQDFVNLS